MMKQPTNPLESLKRIKALAQTGINFRNNEFDTERYEEILHLTDQLMAAQLGMPVNLVQKIHLGEQSYITPKVDVRTLVFEHGKLLLVKEKADGLWALPGGWADVGISPSQVASKEVKEETGLNVTIERLLAVFDNLHHGHPPSPFFVYKLFFYGRVTGGAFSEKGHEVLDAGFFALAELPPLSEERNTGSQIRDLVALAGAHDGSVALFD